MQMTRLFFVADVESTGPDFATQNMYQFGYVPVMEDGTPLTGKSFDLLFSTNNHDSDTLDFLKRDLGLTPDILQARETAVSPERVMQEFQREITGWIDVTGAKKVIFVADNLAFDWGYIHTYFHRYLGKNPFGYAGRNIPDLSLGFYGTRDAWEQHRTQAHTHDALDDVLGNAGALVQMIQDGLKIA